MRLTAEEDKRISSVSSVWFEWRSKVAKTNILVNTTVKTLAIMIAVFG